MTTTFNKFLTQFHATGQQRMQGFDPSHFEGLTPSEQAEAESMLEQQASQLSLIAINALGMLASERAEAILVGLLGKAPISSIARVEILASLWKATGDDRYQKNIAAELNSLDPGIRLKAATALRATTPNAFAFEAFWALLKTEQESPIRSVAARGILRCFGLTTDPYDLGQDHLHLTRKLISADSKLRDEGLAEIRSCADSGSM